MRWLSDTSDAGLHALRPRPSSAMVSIIGANGQGQNEPTPVSPPTWIYVAAAVGVGWMVWRAVRPHRFFQRAAAPRQERDPSFPTARDYVEERHAYQYG